MKKRNLGYNLTNKKSCKYHDYNHEGEICSESAIILPPCVCEGHSQSRIVLQILLPPVMISQISESPANNMIHWLGPLSGVRIYSMKPMNTRIKAILFNVSARVMVVSLRPVACMCCSSYEIYPLSANINLCRLKRGLNGNLPDRERQGWVLLEE